jgi:hypothetical protein
MNLEESNLLDSWYRIKDEKELEAFILAGWTNFTLRPNGSTEWVYINESLLDKGKAQLSLPGFKKKRPPNWVIFRDLLTAIRFHQVCVPGPLSAHEKAQLAMGYNRLLEPSNLSM